MDALDVLDVGAKVGRVVDFVLEKLLGLLVLLSLAFWI